MKLGTRFEKLTEKIFLQLVKNPEYEKVEHDVKLIGKDGPRQIDVLITSEIANMSIKTIVECKDYKGKVSVGVVDSLHSVMSDVNANKAVLVSSNGFSSTAIKKAKRLGISLYTAHEALSDKWKIKTEIPVVVTEISSINLKPKAIVFFNKEEQIGENAFFNINDIDLLEALKSDLKIFPIDHLENLMESESGYRPSSLKSPFYIRNKLGVKKILDDFSLSFKVNKTYYFGYLNDQKDVIALQNIIENDLNIIFKADFLIDYKNTLRKIKKEDIPSVGEVKLDCLVEPELNGFVTKSSKFQKIK